MHELSVCLALMEQVRNVAAKHEALKVETIYLRIGPLSGIEAPLLKNAFPIAAAGTVAEGAALVVEQSDIVVHCTQCEAESTVKPNRLLCSQCGDFRTRLVSGDEMLLERLELDLAPTLPDSLPESAEGLAATT
ncbi:MAG: hydrogenase maturation nickel metallochaperone HypA [Gammaproteobacteria bacterium]